MKRIIIALMVAVTFCSLAMAQNPTITQDNKNSSDSTIVTEYTDIVDSSTVDTDYQSSSFDFGNEFPFNIDKGAINGGILTGLVVIILIFGFPSLSYSSPSTSGIKPESKVQTDGTGTGNRTTSAGRYLQRHSAAGLPYERYQEHLYRNRTVHLPLGHHRRIQHRMHRIAGDVHRNRTVDHLTQSTA